MSEAIVLLNMPENCYECDLVAPLSGHAGLYWCEKEKRYVNECGKGKPDWCPIISETDDETAWYDQGYISGLNDCEAKYKKKIENMDLDELSKLFYKLYDKIVEDNSNSRFKQAVLKLIADGIELLNIAGMNKE